MIDLNEKELLIDWGDVNIKVHCMAEYILRVVLEAQKELCLRLFKEIVVDLRGINLLDVVESSKDLILGYEIMIELNKEIEKNLNTFLKRPQIKKFVEERISKDQITWMNYLKERKNASNEG